MKTNPSTPAPTLPDWLKPEPYPTTRTKLELVEMTYENLFESSIDAIQGGHSLAHIIENDPRNIEFGRFLRWINKNKARRQRLKEAREIAADILVSQTISIADNADPVTANVAKLQIDSRWKTAGKWNPNQYGDKQRIDIRTGELSEAELDNFSTEDLKRMIIEGEYENLPDDNDTEEDGE
jgi:hypothetical protein